MAIEKTRVRKRAGTPPTKAPPKSDLTIEGVTPGVPERICGILFGPPKTGKTTAACGTKGQKVLLMSFDPEGHATETLLGRDDITVVPLRTKAATDDLIRKLHTGASKQFDWIIVDSLTFLFDMLGAKDINDKWAQDKDFRRAYGKAGAAVNQILHDLFVIDDVNIIITAHLEKETSDDDDGIVDVEPGLGENEVKVAVTPMVWRYISGAVSFIGRTYKEQVNETAVVDGKKKRNIRTKFGVSYNDGERSPAGSRLAMDADYEVSDTWLSELESKLKGAA